MNPPNWLTQFADLAHAMPLHVAAVEVRRLQWHMEAPGRWATQWVDLARNLVDPAAELRQSVRRWEAQWVDLARNFSAAVEASKAAKAELGISDADPLCRKVSPRGMVELAQKVRELRSLGLYVVDTPPAPDQEPLTEDERHWIERINQAVASGNKRAYCENRRITRSNFYEWWRRLEDAGRQVPPRKKNLPKIQDTNRTQTR